MEPRAGSSIWSCSELQVGECTARLWPRDPRCHQRSKQGPPWVLGACVPQVLVFVLKASPALPTDSTEGWEEGCEEQGDESLPEPPADTCGSRQRWKPDPAELNTHGLHGQRGMVIPCFHWLRIITQPFVSSSRQIFIGRFRGFFYHLPCAGIHTKNWDLWVHSALGLCL